MSMELTLTHNTFSSSYTKAPSALTESTFNSSVILIFHQKQTQSMKSFRSSLSPPPLRCFRTPNSTFGLCHPCPGAPTPCHDGGPPSALGLTPHTMTFFLQCFPSRYTAGLCPVSMAPSTSRLPASGHCPERSLLSTVLPATLPLLKPLTTSAFRVL